MTEAGRPKPYARPLLRECPAVHAHGGFRPANLGGALPVMRNARLEDAADDPAAAVDHVEVVAVAGMVAQLVARPSKLERNLCHHNPRLVSGPRRPWNDRPVARKPKARQPPA